MKNTQRINATRIEVGNDESLPISLFARDDVPIEPKAIDEARKLSQLVPIIEALKNDGCLSADAALARVALTPDFHRGDGRGIPIGTCLQTRDLVIPKAVGSDICCGMRFVMTDVTHSELEGAGEDLDKRLRHIFFEGGRDIAMTPDQRTALFRDGLPGLFAAGGTPQATNGQEEERRVHSGGRFATDRIYEGLNDFIAGSGGASRDDQIGSIGGGNHFVELQRVAAIHEKQTAYHWGLRKGHIAIMAHSGSVSIGARIGQSFLRKARRDWPAGAPVPLNDFFMLPTEGTHREQGLAYLSAMNNAANFAVANRLHLTLMTAKAIGDSIGREVGLTLVYDSPHNLIWSQSDGTWLHRKGACPATRDETDPNFPDGHPVIVPGSMGTSSWLLRGLGNVASLCSAAHGAGRVKPRGAARRKDPDELKRLRIVTKVDRKGLRADVASALEASLMEEAPSCYKDPTPVIETMTGADIAAAVARMEPILTIKG